MRAVCLAESKHAQDMYQYAHWRGRAGLRAGPDKRHMSDINPRVRLKSRASILVICSMSDGHNEFSVFTWPRRPYRVRGREALWRGWDASPGNRWMWT
ncbi:hypothetical protein TNCT_136381 [Trichonephila clavata]|uniref:Uncharacterized protein n=1 Tax=Trichonephila clavata TaxID=2740835 RepID=A0A8X6J1Z4_TRICU|nr:hypothetical protein TNCT_136381 [Trichonephila clavata]